VEGGFFILGLLLVQSGDKNRIRTMTKKTLPVLGNLSFEEMKKINQFGAEYGSARELRPFLGYSQWRRFEDAIKRAMTSCKQSGNDRSTILPAPAKWLSLDRKVSVK
jgi:hypothetical protein